MAALGFLGRILVGMALQFIGYLLLPKPPGPKPPELTDWDDPTSGAGRPIPVVFGSMSINGLNNMGMWDKAISRRKPKSKKSK